MIKWFTILLSLFLFTSYVVGDQTFVLNNQIAVNSDTIPVSFLMRDCGSPSTLIKIKGGFYKNEDLCSLLTKSGLKDFSLIGNGIQIDLIRSYTSIDSVKDLLRESANGIDVLSNIQFPEHFLFRSISSETNNGIVTGDILITVFEKSRGEDKTLPFSYVIPSQPLSSVRSGSGPYLINIHGNMADLVYRTEGLSIISRVRIIRKTNPDNILVENVRSGKKFQVVVDRNPDNSKKEQ